MKKVFGAFFVLILFINCSQFKAKNVDKENENQQLLDSLLNQCKELNRSPELLEIATYLKEEANKQKNDLFIGYGYNYILNYYLNNLPAEKENIGDTIRFYGQKAKEYFKKANEQIIPLRLEANILRWEIHFANQDVFIRVLNLLKDAENTNNYMAKVDAYSILGTAYLLSGSPQEASNAFQNELQSIRNANTSDSLYLSSNYLYAFSELGDAALQMNDYDKALAYSDSIRKYIDIYKNVMPNTARWEINADIMTVKSLSRKATKKEAYPFVEKLLLYYNDPKIRQTHTYYSIQYALVHYYCSSKEYHRALEIINELIGREKASNNNFNLQKANDLKSNILSFLNRYEEAFLLKQKVLIYTDSINKKNASRQLSEMRTLYEVENLEKQAIESKEEARNSQIVSVFSISICILLVLMILIIKRNSESLKKKNEKLFEQYKNMDKYKETVTNLTISTNSSDNDLRELTLFEKIEKHLKNTQCYREPDITRESLAIQIGTNRQYLTKAIQENINMTFNEYINHHRLEYARQLLVEQTNLSVENIYTSAGFITKSTFYRLFKEKYSLTPKELRDLALEETFK